MGPHSEKNLCQSGNLLPLVTITVVFAFFGEWFINQHHRHHPIDRATDKAHIHFNLSETRPNWARKVSELKGEEFKWAYYLMKEIMGAFEWGLVIPTSCQAFLWRIPALPHCPTTTRIPLKRKVSVLAAFTLWSGPSRQRDMQLGGGRRGPVLSNLQSNQHALSSLPSKFILYASPP